MPERKCRPSGKVVSLNTRHRYSSAAAPVTVESHHHQDWDGTPVLSSQDSTNEETPASHQLNESRINSQQAPNSLSQLGKTDGSVTSLLGLTSEQISASSTRDLVRQAFNAFPRPGSDPDYERAWEIYKAKQGITRVEIIEYLSSSPRVLDAKRIRKMFGKMSYAERVPQAYRAMIAALLVLKNKEAALKVHAEAKERQFRTSFGTNLLFAYAINERQWQLAFSLWYAYWQEVQRHRIVPVLWDDVVKLPNLIERALALASFLRQKDPDRLRKRLSSREGEPPSNESSDFRISHPEEFLKFASGVIRTAVFRANDPNDAQKIDQLIREFKNVKGNKKYYERAIMHFFQVKMPKVALKIYYYYRKLEAYHAPQRTMLDAILNACCEAENAEGIQFVLDDWTKFYGAPSVHTYREAMRYFARLGDAKVVEALLYGHRERVGRPRDTRELVLLMQAYARQGELRKAVNCFNEIESKFGLKHDHSCWNTLLYAYSKSEDVEGASRCLNEMRNSGLPLDSYTLGTMINMCGRRGDVEGVLEFFDLAEEKGIEMTTEMYDGLILAHINNGDVDHAQDLAEKAMSTKLRGSYTRMWNYVLHARAFERRIERTIEVYKRMHQLTLQGYPVQPDHLTYATLMQAFVQLKDSISANEILENMLIPRGDIKVTSLHYALVMAAYLRRKMPGPVFKTYERMIKRGLKPSMNANVALARAGILADKRFKAEGGIFNEADNSLDAEKVLERVLANTNVMEVAGPDPLMWKAKQPISTAYPAVYFDYLIFLYGRRKAFDKVKSLYKLYLQTSNERGRDEVVSPPLRMINALIMASRHQRDYDDVERYWKLAAREATKQSRKWNNSDTTKPGWVAPARRYILAYPLTQYLIALADQGRIQEMKDTVNRVIWDGYQLDKTNWNIFIQLLAMHGQLEAALGHCERELMPSWRGWKEQRKLQGLPRLRSRAYHLPYTARPFYRTMLYLARGLMDMIESQPSAVASQAFLRDITAAFPRTLPAIWSTPNREDDLQTMILRRR